MVALSAGPKVTPMDSTLAVMRDPHVALDMRVKMALKALPRLHRKLRAGKSPSVVGDQSSPKERGALDRSGGSEARIIMGDDENALLRLWREKRGEVEPKDLSGNLIVQLGW